MWLINTTSFKLEHFVDYDRVEYAILRIPGGMKKFHSKKFRTLQTPSPKKGYRKIEMSGSLARQRGLKYVWVDTCGIEKSNNVELTEAINSMFSWYQRSATCFAYLSDLPPRQQLVASSPPRTPSFSLFIRIA